MATASRRIKTGENLAVAAEKRTKPKLLASSAAKAARSAKTHQLVKAKPAIAEAKPIKSSSESESRILAGSPVAGSSEAPAASRTVPRPPTQRVSATSARNSLLKSLCMVSSPLLSF